MASESFDNLNPGKRVTDPDGEKMPRSAEYPRHLHKWAGADRMNDYVIVTNDKEKAAALKKGYALQPVTEDPAAPTEQASE